MDLERIPLPAREEMWKVADSGVEVLESRANRLWEELTGVPVMALKGRGFWKRVHPDDRGPLLRALRMETGEVQVRLMLNGEWKRALMFFHASPAGGGVHHVLSLYHFIDTLIPLRTPGGETLPGREGFLQRLAEKIEEKPGYLAVVVLEVDRFGDIQTLYGPDTGKKIVDSIVEQIHDRLGDDLIVGVLGPGKVGLVLLGAEGYHDLLRAVGMLSGLFEHPVVLEEGERLFPVIHIGTAVYPLDATDATGLVEHAERILQSLHRHARKSHGLIAVQAGKDLQDLMSLRRALVEALREEKLHLHYQPIFDLRTLRVVGVEALVRWRHPHLGEIPPGRFIPLVEQLGMMGHLTDFILRRSFEDVQRLPGEDLWISVNFSPTELLTKQLVVRMEQALERTGMDPRRVVVEITESTAIDNPRQAFLVFQRLKQMGIRVALDDFGSGYATMEHLLNLNPDKLKLDRTFVAHVAHNARAFHIAQTIVDLAHNLGAQAVAEGIEDHKQLKILQTWGCDEGQGFLLARPMPVDRLRGFLAQRAGRAPLG